MADQLYCCYHGDEAAFKSTFGVMRKVLHIPQTLSKACAMSVCTCRKGDLLHRTPIAHLESLESQGKYTSLNLLAVLEDFDLTDTVKASTRQFISDLLIDKNMGRESAARLVYVFYMALDKNFSLLDEELNDRNTKLHLKHTAPKEKKVVNKHVQLRCVMARRKRQAGAKLSETLTLTQGRQIFRFDPHISSLLHSISKDFKPCVVEPNQKKLAERGGSYTNCIPVTIWCEKKRLYKVVDELRRKIKLPTVGQPIHRYPRHFLRIPRGFYGSNVNDTLIIDNILHAKEAKTVDYGKKTQRNPSHSERSTPVAGIKNSVKCYNCQQPQFSLATSTTVNKNNKGVSCRYHPGFMAGGKWSCCQQDPHQHLEPFQEHSLHGCTLNQSHKWLYQSKSHTKSTGGKYLTKNLTKNDFSFTVQMRSK